MTRNLPSTFTTSRFDLTLDRFAPYGALLVRLVLASVFLSHVHAKIFDYTIPGTQQFFMAHGFPGWTVYPVIVAEVVGGAAFLLGLRSRWIALGVLPVMFGAITPHLGNGWIFSNPGGGWEFPAIVTVLLVAHALLGTGALSLDRWLERNRQV
jgi:putative oxidoreductase